MLKSRFGYRCMYVSMSTDCVLFHSIIILIKKFINIRNSLKFIIAIRVGVLFFKNVYKYVCRYVQQIKKFFIKIYNAPDVHFSCKNLVHTVYYMKFQFIINTYT